MFGGNTKRPVLKQMQANGDDSLMDNLEIILIMQIMIQHQKI